MPQSGTPPTPKEQPVSCWAVSICFMKEHFPGCVSKRIPRRRIRDYDSRFEFLDADTEVAMVCGPISYYHEIPSQRLARLG